MKGFKDTTKTVKGHHFPGDPQMPGYASGGIVARMAGEPRFSQSPPRPIMPRPRVMPNLAKSTMPKMAKLAKGGRAPVMQGKSDGGGGPYNNPDTGNSLSMANRPYSQIEVEHPRTNARPGYKKGGKKGGIHIKPSHKGLFTKKMTGSKSGKLTDAKVNKGLHSDSAATRKQANFARMARRHFKPLAKGGRAVGYAEGGPVCDTDTMQGIADRTISRHVATPKPRGHGVKGGNLAFSSKPLFGK